MSIYDELFDLPGIGQASASGGGDLMNTNDLTGEIGFLARELKTAVIGLAPKAGPTSSILPQSSAARSPPAPPTAPGCGSQPLTYQPVKTIEDFVFDHIPAASRDLIAHLATCTFIPKRENVVLLGPPGTGETHLAIALGIKAAEAAHPVLFDSATG